MFGQWPSNRTPEVSFHFSLAGIPLAREKNMQPKTIRITEFCRLYGLGKTKTYALIKQGRLQAIRIDGRTLITTESADALVTQSKVEVE